ncbi:MGMT family protein [Candidatus Woesearchaeota archaeon]|nr:MGMT family protein [Candidatus Woesearchaeota archaeon]
MVTVSFESKVWELCRKIPKGKLTTYKEIGKALHTKAYRAVGQALKKNKNTHATPCHRVVNSNGSLGGYYGKLNSIRKINLLEKEGIKVEKGRIANFKEKLFSYPC